MARLHAGSGTGTAGKQAVAAPRSLLGAVVLQLAEGTTAMPTGLSESGEGGAWPRVCCYWTEVLDVAANQERGRLRRAEGGARVAIATGTPLGRARLCGGRGELEGTGADVGTGAKRGKAAVRRQGGNQVRLRRHSLVRGVPEGRECDPRAGPRAVPRRA